ncbi:DUF3794 domain-containing protein [Romboutsia sp.]|uniref:DUF3794 domain-containing protein n=1 Tax=Romboutsia sp. TaxID=1965302 RepID=UPI002BCCAF7B|nr:DUF3794 domain-containing protein [Romboutsia sp.]HSQ87536.1 DUF3794 domain-containing protein [Romboutsia sp.]
MASIVKNLIEYVGIADYCDMPANIGTCAEPGTFKQLTIQENLKIPAAKPDIEQIVKVMAEVSITSTKIIETPGKNYHNGVSSLEGQNLTGWKLIVEGFINQKIEYVADEPTQSVHAAHFKIPFSTFIVLPYGFTKDNVVTVLPYIEDIYAKQMDKRNIFKNITMLLNAVVSC